MQLAPYELQNSLCDRPEFIEPITMYCPSGYYRPGHMVKE